MGFHRPRGSFFCSGDPHLDTLLKQFRFRLRRKTPDILKQEVLAPSSKNSGCVLGVSPEYLQLLASTSEEHISPKRFRDMNSKLKQQRKREGITTHEKKRGATKTMRAMKAVRAKKTLREANRKSLTDDQMWHAFLKRQH